MPVRRRPGEIRDAIRSYLAGRGSEATVAEIYAALEEHFGEPVPSSSVRSSLNFGVGDLYERTGRGTYRIKHG
jgi:hypothetical protein